MFLLSLSEIYSKRSRTTSLADLSSSTSSSTAFFTFGSTSICSASPGRSSTCSTSWNKSLRAACGPPPCPMSRTSRRGDSSSFLSCLSLLLFHHTIPLASRQFHSAVRPAVVTRALAQQWHVQPSTIQRRRTWTHVWPHHVFPFVCPRLCRVGADSWGTVWLTNLPPTTRPSLHPPVEWGLKTNDLRGGCKRIIAKVGKRRWRTCRASIKYESGAESEENSSRAASSTTTTSPPLEEDRHYRWRTTRGEPKSSNSWRTLESRIDCREHCSTCLTLAVHSKESKFKYAHMVTVFGEIESLLKK